MLKRAEAETPEIQVKNTIRVAYLEVYNETVRDLFSAQDAKSLSIVEDPQKGIVVPGLQEIKVKNLKDTMELISKGNKRRIMASTNSNEFSSRSHAIIQLSLDRAPINFAKLSIVDLAGSEKDYPDRDQKQRYEGSSINISLLALGSCIKVLSHKSSSKFVPYRNSKLTRLLKDSLGGKAKTVMIACISPSIAQYEETLNTLKYA